MIIKRIRLHNFRQFYGKQELAFAVEGTRNVTLVHAENGFGKTSILNAVLWALFREHTPKFEKPEDIVNYAARDEGEKTATVEVEFEFKGKNYLVRRQHFDDRDARDKTVLEAYTIHKGNSQLLNAPATFVETVIPREMAKYFFFDGEAAETFASAKNSQKIQDAIRNILGCSLAETALSDLKELSKSVVREIGDKAGDKAIEQLEKQLQAKGEEIDLAVKTREMTINNIATWKTQKDEIVERLREMQGAAEIQKLRDHKNARIAQIEGEIRELDSEILKWIGQRAIQVVSRRLTQIALDFIDEASLRGRIPSPYNEDFVRGLLSANTCVCSRPLVAGSHEWACVGELLKKANNAEMQSRIVRARARMQQLQQEAAQAPSILHTLQTKLAKADAEKGKLEQEVAELSDKIGNLPIAEIADREKSRRHLEKKIEEEQQNLGGIKVHLIGLDHDKKRLGDELDNLVRHNKRTAKLLVKRQLLARAESLLRGLLEAYEKTARADIEQEINRILEIVAHKDYRCRFTDQFTLELILNDRASPKSGGENQLLSLVFIASLVRFSKNRIDQEHEILRPGTIAPLVLDAPLGQLDPSYQQSIAEYLPKLAHQIVLLVSGSQGGAAVLSNLAPFVAAEYLLIQHNAGSRGKKSIPTRTLHGKEREVAVYSAARTMTQIETVTP